MMAMARERELEIIASLEGHPHRLEAESHLYCEAVVLEIPVGKLNDRQLEIDILEKLQKSFDASIKIIAAIFMTADEIPEPLAGAGVTYAFLLHPVSLEILHTFTGEWRS